MKNLLLAVAILTFGILSSAAKPVKLSMDLTLNGKLSHPTVTTNFGEKATVAMIGEAGNGYQISIVPSEVLAGGKPAVKLEMQVFKVQNKLITDVSNPNVITLLGEKAQISQSGQDSFELSVTPTL